MAQALEINDPEKSFAEHEHREIRDGIEHMEAVATTVGWMSSAELLKSVRRVRDWTTLVLGPHAAWEGAVLYPRIDAAAGTPWATKLMRFEHRQIARMAQRLDSDIDALSVEFDDAHTCAIRVRLGALAALLRAHVERENEFLFPLLGDPAPG